MLGLQLQEDGFHNTNPKSCSTMHAQYASKVEKLVGSKYPVCDSWCPSISHDLVSLGTLAFSHLNHTGPTLSSLVT